MAVKALSLKHNVFYGLIGNVIFALTQWGILAVVARLGTPEEVGAITIATALVTPIFFLAAMSMREGHSVDDMTDFTTDHYFALRLINSLVAVVIIVGLLFTWYGGAGALVQTTTLAFTLVKFFGTQANMNYGVFQRSQRLDYVAISYSARGLAGLAGFALAYVLTETLWVAFVAEAAMWIGGQVLMDRRFLAKLGVESRFSGIFQVSAKSLWKLFWWMLPLGFAGFLMNATSSAPRLVLAQHVDLAMVGVFGAISYINTALATVTNAIGSASAARLRRTVREGRRTRFKKLSFKLVAMSAVIGLGLIAVVWLAGPLILTILYGEAYVDQQLFLLVIIGTAARVTAAPLQFALTAGHAYWRRVGINLAAFAATLISAVLLIPEQGATGAAFAILIGTAIRILLLVFYFFRLSISIQPPIEERSMSL